MVQNRVYAKIHTREIKVYYSIRRPTIKYKKIITWEIKGVLDHTDITLRCILSKHDILNQCWMHVGSASSTVDQRQNTIGATCRVYWVSSSTKTIHRYTKCKKKMFTGSHHSFIFKTPLYKYIPYQMHSIYLCDVQWMNNNLDKGVILISTNIA